MRDCLLIGANAPRGVAKGDETDGVCFTSRTIPPSTRYARCHLPLHKGGFYPARMRRKVSPKATKGGMSHARRAGRASRRRGRVYFFCQARQKKIPKRTRLKGYANREGYALIYYDIARLFFFPKRTIRLYFNSRLWRSKRAVCEHSGRMCGGVKGSLV